MTYNSLCPINEASKPGISEIAKAISTGVLQAFSGYVIPHRTINFPKFTDDDCEFYVNKRDWIAKTPLQHNVPYENQYENLFEALFWGTGFFSEHSDIHKLIFLFGTIGSGKSTFIDYYLRCFCPTKSEKQHLFQEKLIVHADLKNRQTNEAVDEKIWRDLQSSIHRAGIDPMDVYDFESERNPNQRLIRRVLAQITDSMLKGKLGDKKYLVLVIDNIDQSPISCQTHCLSFVQEGIAEYKCK